MEKLQEVQETEKGRHFISYQHSQLKGIVLGQRKMGENGDKSSEIPAIPPLIDILGYKGSVITMDAMGCQKALAEKIVSKEADYVLALKGKKSGVHGMLKDIFDEKFKDIPPAIDGFEDKEYSHKRRERRYFRATEDI